MTGLLRLSLRWRVAVAFGLASVLLAGVLALVTWNLASGYLLRQREQSATRQAEVSVRLVESSLGEAGPGSTEGGLEELLTGLTSDAESSVLLARDGGWLTSGRQVDPRVLPADLLRLAADGMPARQRLVVDGLPVLAVALPVRAPGSLYVQLFSLSQLDRIYRFLSSVLLAGTAASAVLGVAIGSWASARALRPLTGLTDAASRMARGDLTARLPEQDDPDLAPLAETFNRTADALEARVRRDARFAGDVSHELRSPLTTMANAAAVLSRRAGGLPAPGRRALELLVSEVDRFQRMVVDLLEISRDDQRPEAPGEAVDLGVLVRRVVAARSGSVPEPEVADPVPPVRGDRRRLERVVANLLDNAAHHGGGAVRVAVGHADGRVRLEVDDAGPGVPPGLREQVFERFARGALAGRRGADSGTGLGLALVAQHVERHDGATWVEDRPGGGARFVVEIPRMAP